jgi:hypothetical protein
MDETLKAPILKIGDSYKTESFLTQTITEIKEIPTPFNIKIKKEITI